MVQWLGVGLPMQGTQVGSLVWEDPTYSRATKPVSPRAHAPPREATAMRCLCTTTREEAHSMQLENSSCSNEDPAQPKLNQKF